MVTSWPLLVAAVCFATMAARSWRHVIRHGGSPAGRGLSAPFSRVLGEKAKRRLERVSSLHAVCLTGLTVLFLGGAWLPEAGSHAPRNHLALGVVTTGLAVFLLGLLGQCSVALFGGPRFLLTGIAPDPSPRSAATPAASNSSRTQIAVCRDPEDTYAQLRQYKVFVDGRHVGGVNRGEACIVDADPGDHSVQVKISWCSSPVVRVNVVAGERTSLLCVASPGAATDPVRVLSRRAELLALRQL